MSLFLYGVRKCSSFILLQVVDQFSQHLVKDIVFPPLYILASFVKDKVSIGVWLYLWAFCFVPLIYTSVFVPVLYHLDDCGLEELTPILLKLFQKIAEDGKLSIPSYEVTITLIPKPDKGIKIKKITGQYHS